MEKFVIQGGEPLSGELTVAGNKNAALPILAACLLTEEELLLHRVPRIRDTEAQISLLERLGVEAGWVGDNSLRLCAASVSEVAVDEELSAKIRASFLLAGPLLARFGEARMPPPGGDFIGRRRLDPEALEQCDLRLGVADPRHPVQEQLLLGEKAGGEDRQSRVLVAGDGELARERLAALYDEFLHGTRLG